jgi:hypothetical protein
VLLQQIGFLELGCHLPEILIKFVVLSSLKQVSLVCVSHQQLEIVVLSFKVLANVKELSALVFPEVTLHVFALQCLHFYTQTF